MANATTHTQTLVHLTLTEEEAQTLVEVLACVGGGEVEGHRNRARSISEALSTAGFEFTSLNSGNFPFEQHARSLLFRH